MQCWWAGLDKEKEEKLKVRVAGFLHTCGSNYVHSDGIKHLLLNSYLLCVLKVKYCKFLESLHS